MDPGPEPEPDPLETAEKLLDGDLPTILADPHISSKAKVDHFKQHIQVRENSTYAHPYHPDRTAYLYHPGQEDSRRLLRQHLPGDLPPSGQLHILSAHHITPLHLVDHILQRIHPDKLPQSLHIATLGFKPLNIEHLVTHYLDPFPDLQLTILVSEFFHQYSEHLEPAKARLNPYADRARIYTAHSHAKVVLLDLQQEKYTIYGSANLSSCYQLEQLTLSKDPNLYTFHHDWITRTHQCSI